MRIVHRAVLLACCLRPKIINLAQCEQPQISVEWGGVAVLSKKICIVSETGPERTNDDIDR